MARRSHHYVSRDEKRERGIPLNIWDAARSLQTRRVAAGEEKTSLRSIIKEDDFRRAWNIWRDRKRSFLVRVDAAEMFGWWQQESDGRWRYVS